MAEWIYEDGIGEARAALIEDGQIVEAAIEVDGTAPRVGTVLDARLSDIQLAGKRGVAVASEGTELLVAPLLEHWTLGQQVRVEVRREAIGENLRTKRPMAVPAIGRELREGLTLLERLTARTERGVDRLEEVGWSELLDAAATGIVPFDGGSLLISPTPAMTLFDVDGWLAPEPLALAAATATGSAIRRLGIGGSIGIDFPTVEGKAARLAVAAALDARLPQPFERTALNGFGFLQIVRPRLRASLIEHVRADFVGHAARALLRRVEHERRTGAVRLVGPAPLIQYLHAHPDWLDRLARAQGGAVGLRTDAALPMSAAYAEPA